MIVAGADVGVAAQPARLLTYHQRQFAVGLQPDHAVDDVHPSLLQLSGPGDVVLFVETGLDLHHGEDLLSRLGGLDEGVDDGGVTRGAVQGLFDGQHRRVGGGLFDEPLHAGGERVVGVLYQHVTAFQRLEHVGGGGRLHLRQVRMGDRQETWVFEVLATRVLQGEQARQVEGGR